MKTQTKQRILAVAASVLFVGLLGWFLFVPAERVPSASEFTAKPSPAIPKGAIVLVAFHPSLPQGGPCEYAHDGVAKQEPALLRIPGIADSQEPVIVVWSPECTVRDQWAFCGFASKFGIHSVHYLVTEDGKVCLSLRSGNAFPSSRPDPLARAPGGSAYEASLSSGRLVVKSGNASLGLAEWLEKVRSGMPARSPQNLDIYLDEGLPLVKVGQIARSLSTITKNYRLLRDNGFYATPLYVGESSIEYASKPKEPQK